MQIKYILLIALISAIFVPKALNNPVVPTVLQSTEVISKVEEIKPMEPKVEIKTIAIKPVLRKELVPICSCESKQGKKGKPTHFEKDGKTVLRGKINPLDIGMCQINLRWHGEAAKKKGLDLFKEEDNITYANHLYAKQGSQPWNWSKACWQ